MWRLETSACGTHLQEVRLERSAPQEMQLLYARGTCSSLLLELLTRDTFMCRRKRLVGAVRDLRGSKSRGQVWRCNDPKPKPRPQLESSISWHHIEDSSTKFLVAAKAAKYKYHSSPQCPSIESIVILGSSCSPLLSIFW